MRQNTNIKNIIELKNLSIFFSKRKIIENLNLEIRKGSFHVIMGKSGIGKSTLLYILAGLLRPTKGTYLFNNKKVYTIGEFGLSSFRRKNIGFLFQDFRLIPFLNVEQNIKMPLYFSGVKFVKKELYDLLEQLQILHIRKSYQHQISGGEAQRTAIARAILHKPSVLLLDEPTGNIDYKTEKEIIKILNKIKEDGMTLICATHSKILSKEAEFVWELKNKTLNQVQKKSKRI